MKKTFIAAIAAACAVLVSSCGGMNQGGLISSNAGAQGTTQTVPQQNGGLGGILGGLSGIGDIISGALGITTTDIVGTWVYQEPAVLFESDNLLTKAGGQIAAQKVAAKMDTYFQKVGISKGKMTMTFDKQGNFTQAIGSKQQTGTYTVQNGQVNLTFPSGHGQIVGTTQFSGNNLVIVVDVTKLMTFAQTIAASSNNSTLGALSTLSQGVTGMKTGLKFTKK